MVSWHVTRLLTINAQNQLKVTGQCTIFSLSNNVPVHEYLHINTLSHNEFNNKKVFKNKLISNKKSRFTRS